MKKILLFVGIILCSSYVYGQLDEYYPEFQWYTIKGEHVEVHYHEGSERTAKVVAKIADEVWGPITSLYEYEPNTIHYVIKDIHDYANGASFFLDNKIEIWTSSLDFDLRGNHHWLRNVITHEFTHMVQIQAGLKFPRRMPAVYLQWLNYEDKRRPDILYGFPNVIASYPVAGLNIPAWFAEGTAQYQRQELDYERWDAHRDMILRSYILDGNMLSWESMAVFGKNSLGNESVYNAGYALTRYISQKYGEDNLRLITERLGAIQNFTISAAIEDVLGISGEQLYEEWIAFLKDDYEKRVTPVRENLVAGDTIAQVGIGNFYPMFNEDGTKLYYISNKTNDYLGLTSLYRYDFETEKDEMVISGVRSNYSKIPGTDKIIYSKLTNKNPNGYRVHDLFEYDLETEEETRLTFYKRANRPNISNDGKHVVFLVQRDGTTNLALMNLDTEEIKNLTFFDDGEQVYNPKFSPDDSYIVFDFSFHHGRDIARVSIDGSGYKKIIETDDDERNPVFDANGNIIYASDKTGIFNLYRYYPESGKQEQLTNVLGGAFMPDIDNEGNIAYAGYTSDGYKIFYLKNEDETPIPETQNYFRYAHPPLDKQNPKGDIAQFDTEYLKNFDDVDVSFISEPEKYSPSFTSMTFYPMIRFDNYNTSNSVFEKLKFGGYAFSTDMLNKYSIFAGASINTRLERDLFLQFDYRDKLPLLYSLGLKPNVSLEVYNISRIADVDINFEEFDPVPTDVTYNLLEVDIVANHELFNDMHDLELRYVFSRYSAAIGSFVIPNVDVLYPSTDDVYLLGSEFRMKYEFDMSLPYRDSDISPIGFKTRLQYSYEMNRFNKDGEYEIENGMLKPLYNHFNFHRVELFSRGSYPLWGGHVLEGSIRAAAILGPGVPDFFDFYLGGLIGMKAYPFYAVSGNELFWGHLEYRFPLFRNIDTRIGHLYLDKVFVSVYADIGDAWTGDENWPDVDELKKGAGAEVRIQMNSFYLFPTSVFFNASYGFDEINREIDENIVTYGKEWRFYGGILFGFDLL